MGVQSGCTCLCNVQYLVVQLEGQPGRFEGGLHFGKFGLLSTIFAVCTV